MYIRGRKRVGLIDDEELSGLRIGLVRTVFNLNIFKKLNEKLLFLQKYVRRICVT